MEFLSLKIISFNLKQKSDAYITHLKRKTVVNIKGHSGEEECSMFQTLTRLKKRLKIRVPAPLPPLKLTLCHKAQQTSWMNETSLYVNFLRQQALLSHWFQALCGGWPSWPAGQRGAAYAFQERLLVLTRQVYPST